ncbi:family 16 glycosylhydrolase [Acuticoccus sp. M5D2P5]|uniref:family 16 glycosylhydrolase n=1 Tax=Acuticoccus kalidii TaxID=2910977 RepID=UPI001F3F2FD8|nr:family 16 glycosylhydrolase [Acuticoccus kalidii]MCF3931927.1 family 16 glycosylhydrolase [Acuticoccus kalidii]
MSPVPPMRSLSALALSLVLAGPAVAGDAFIDRFDRLDGQRWTISNGWTNGAHMGCIWQRDEVSVGNGALYLRLTKTPTETDKGETRDYACAEIQSRETYGFGLYEARIKAARGSGLVSAFFTYTGPHLGDPHDEIDVEILGRSMDEFDSNHFVAGKDQGAVKIPLAAPADRSIIDYAFEWTPDALRWYVNGTLVREVTEGPMPEADQKIFFSIWNGGRGTTEWLGEPDPSIEWAAMMVDYVAYTPIGETCRFAGSASCSPNWEVRGTRADEGESATQ